MPAAPPGNGVVYCRSCTARRPQALRQCSAIVALPTAPGQCGSVWDEFHCSLPPGCAALYWRSCTAPLPGGSGRCNSCDAQPHCPQAVGLCMAGFASPAAPRQ